MTEYICVCCDYSTRIRTHYQRHLATKKHIKNAHQENEKGINKSLYTTISPQNTTKIPQKRAQIKNILKITIVSIVPRVLVELTH